MNFIKNVYNMIKISLHHIVRVKGEGGKEKKTEKRSILTRIKRYGFFFFSISALAYLMT